MLETKKANTLVEKTILLQKTLTNSYRKKGTEPSSKMPEAKKTNTLIEKIILCQKCFKKIKSGLSKIPVTFWYVRTPCASPLRGLARVRISAYPIHRMQNSRDFCMLQSKSNFLCKPQHKREEFCGSGLAPRCHWRKRYYHTQIYEESFFLEILLKDLAGQGEPAPAPFCLARILRQRLFRSDSVFSQNIILWISWAKKNKKRAFYDQSTHPKEQFSIRHVTSLVNKQDTS